MDNNNGSRAVSIRQGLKKILTLEIEEVMKTFEDAKKKEEYGVMGEVMSYVAGLRFCLSVVDKVIEKCDDA